MLLEAAGFDVRARVSGADESWPDLPAREAVRTLAKRKMDALAAQEDLGEAALTADTVVFLDGEPLNKPDDDEHAKAMLARLSGREHDVVTAFCLRRGAAEHTESVTTRVLFRRLRDVEIEHYVATGEPRDKAGAYGIQGDGGALVDRLEGSYTNVVGLPLAEVLRALEVTP